ncbi:hypothetical protein DXG01_002478 [Tephrocybe rancida]|nr:hypothetical protein DXG01_002478 [Tephrocybe rancida]
MDLETKSLDYVVVDNRRNPLQRIIFVDTPGFNNSLVDDAEILRRIVLWLAKSSVFFTEQCASQLMSKYARRTKLAGVIYLHEISQARTPGPALWKNLEHLSGKIGDDGSNRGGARGVVLATTKWSEVPKEVGERREQSLKDNDWEAMIGLGSQVRQYHDTNSSAWGVVEPILDHVAKVHTIEEDLQEIERIIARIRGNLS